MGRLFTGTMRDDSGQPPEGFDVVVCGGGLAGLTLALQLRREVPEASVAVVDKARRPLPEACHKVGESTVELGAHYLADIVGLRPYLEREQLPKNGLRFFTEGGALPLHERSEIGPSDFPVVPSFQVDRGKLENDLRDMCEQRGVTLLEGRAVADVDIAEGDAPNAVRLEGVERRARAGATDSEEAPKALQARWIVDATGRRRLIQRKLGLHQDSANRQSAAWFRVRGHVKVGDLVPETERGWHQKDVDGNRWLSTNHLMGRGYWVWLIPLGTGFTSIGIVADAGCHPFDRYNRPEQARAWLAEHEPHLAAHIADLEFADFRVLRHYSYFSQRLLSTDRWICVGEAGVFVDPLYSPGTDFIGIGNGFASRLIADDVAGRFDPRVAEELNRFGLRAARDGMNSLSGNADIFQHGKTMGSKLWWDFFSYWSFLCQYFAQGIYRLPLEQLQRF
ncbi:MAG: NAD(P)/FAD-dependent oxidoreductase, partial [Polyangiales bacterium]